MTTHYSSEYLVRPYPMLLGYLSKKDGTKQVTVRVRVKHRKTKKENHFNITCRDEYGDAIKLTPAEFNSNRYDIEIKTRLADIQEKSVFAVHHFLTHNIKISQKEIQTFVYEQMEAEQDKQKIFSSEYVTDPVIVEQLKELDITDPVAKDVVNKVSAMSSNELKSDELTDEDSLNEILTWEQVEYDKRKQKDEARKIIERREAEIKAMSFEERYAQGEFNKDDILEVFGFCWSRNSKNKDPYVAESYKAFVLHLADYYVNGSKVSHYIADFNLKWVENFLTFKYNNGYPKKFHPIRYTPFDILEYHDKFVESEREIYTVARFRKIVAMLKRYVIILKGKGLIPNDAIDIDLIEASEYISRKVNADNFTRIEYTLDYEEIEELTTASFNDKRMQLATDMYIIQMFAGGLRPSELYNGELRFETDYVAFYRSKNKKISKNPILLEVESVMKKYPNGLPTFLPIKEYREELKKVAMKLKWNRRIDVPNTKLNADKPTKKLKLYEIFYPLTARKSFVNYLANLGLPDDRIIQFTDQSDVKILRHYKKSLNLQQKKVIMQSLLEKWEAKEDI